MQITNVRINLIKNAEKLKAVAEVTFDHCFVVKDIKIVETKEGFMVGMPSKKVTFGKTTQYIDVAHPIAPGFRKDLEAEVLKAYEEELKKTEKPKKAAKKEEPKEDEPVEESQE